MSDIKDEKSVEVDEGIEKSKQRKINYVQTEARKEAFKRCREARQKQLQLKKELKAEKQIEDKLGKDIKEQYDKFKEENKIDEKEQIIEKGPTPTQPIKQTKKTKPKVNIKYESESSSDSDTEYIVKKVSTRKRQTKKVVEEQPVEQPVVETKPVIVAPKPVKKILKFV